MILDLLQYWGSHPPVHVLVKAFTGVGSTRGARVSKIPTEDELKAAIAEFNGK